MELNKIVAEGPSWVMYLDEKGEVITIKKGISKQSQPAALKRQRQSFKQLAERVTNRYKNGLIKFLEGSNI